MKLTLIAAVARNGTIGNNNQLLWQEPLDQRHFRAATLGHPVVMGRKTWDSLPARFRPLPGRTNVVVTRQTDWAASGALAAASLDAALAMLAAWDEVFVIGGGELYCEALPLADRLVLTEVDVVVPDADTFFPAWNRADFVATPLGASPPETQPPCRWTDYERRR